MCDCKDYLKAAIETFVIDPADTEFQKGYQQALMDAYADLYMTQEERALNRAKTGTRQ